MPAVSRQDDQCSGHGCFPPRRSTAGSPNVFCTGKPVLRKGDPFEAHSCGDHTHTATVSAGSGTVFVNGLALARIGDALDCGSVVAAGSPNVFAGG